MTARDVDHLFFVTGTGIATPSLDARIVNQLGMRSDVRRTPIFGLGCAGGVAGVIRAADVLRGFPGQVAMVVSAELCSLTLQRTDDSVANIIASALFGDGAAAVLLGGGQLADRGAGIAPRVVATRSIFYPDSERMMGWDVVDSGFKIVLSPAIPDLVREHLGGDVDAMLASMGLRAPRLAIGSHTPVAIACSRRSPRRSSFRPARWIADGGCSPRPATCLRPRCCLCCATCSTRARRGPASTD